MPVPYAEPGNSYNQGGTESYGAPGGDGSDSAPPGGRSAWRQPPPPPRKVTSKREFLMSPIARRASPLAAVARPGWTQPRNWNGGLEEAGALGDLPGMTLPPCARSVLAPWLAPCCSDCAKGAAAGAVGDSATSSSSSSSTGNGALLVLGGFFVLVVFGQKWLAKHGG
jgi:hypothetical protein